MLSGESKLENGQPGPDLLMSKHQKIDKEHPKLQEHILVLLLNALLSKLSGHHNPVCDEKVAAFCVALQASSPAACQLVRANLPSPHIRTLQRKNKQFETPHHHQKWKSLHNRLNVLQPCHKQVRSDI